MTTGIDTRKAGEIFFPHRLRKYEQIISEEFKFVQYTSAQAAMSFIKNEEVWLRNTRCMNDYLEIEHGLDCLVKAFHSESTGKRFKDILLKIYPNLKTRLVENFDGWIPKFRDDTYVTCVSEHPKGEDQIGRLSMWRAYGGRQSVAVVLNSSAFQRETESNVFEVDIAPVIYLDASGFEKELNELTGRIEAEIDFVKTIGEETVFAYLFEFFKNVVFTVKHPGFSEEREWRAIYNPSYKPSNHVVEEIVCIDGIPQRIQKIPIKDIPEEGLTEFSVPHLIDRIIIGPNDNQIILGDAFARLLKHAGCKSPEKKIHYSGIPLR